ncbi:hypothetical protein [Mucilaginibacter dorajii]|uniref:Carboxypeptidase-like regulatory domain-containing protein n=1 Tax=Mucilaginibacter dorajii TaxID=692994 RepID=A0ABP7PVR3_9SPHI|nr:hypothetical protein [Mucilaginibacter dorajii]MCS3734940.1 hypothetical protein [Mucilaginibacter dorajii]
MKKYILTLLLPYVAVQATIAQSITASGTVKNEQGNAIASALVQVADAKEATYTDSLGFFSLPVKNNNSLLVVAKGYKDEKVNPKENLVVVLKAGQSTFKGNNLSDPDKITTTANGQQNQTHGFTYFNMAGTGGALYNIARKEDTKGSRYLVDEGWAKGFVVDKSGAAIKNDNYSYNYDKINGSLLLTQDKRAAIDVSRDQIKSFTIYDKTDQPQTFELITAINPTHYSQVLADGAKYKVYKYTTTTFVKANYQTDGMTSTGNRYDEYVDEPVYYVYNVKTSALQPIAIKSKAIKQAFAADADKVKAYYSEHADDDINETFLKNLADSLN